jgi:hypothetical protein
MEDEAGVEHVAFIGRKAVPNFSSKSEVTEPLG